MSEQRREDVLRAVEDAGRVGLADLAAAAGVSQMTVRRDLDELTRRGLLRRVRGGAISLDADSHAGRAAGTDPAEAARVAPGTRGRAGAAAGGAPTVLHGSPAAAPPPSALPRARFAGAPGAAQDRAGLERAARAVAEAVPPGATVLLDAGPGAAQVAAHLARRAPLTVAVTSLECAVTLATSPGVRLVVLGGEPRAGEPGLLGPAALTALGDLHLDLYVMTPAGLDATGVWVRSPDAAALARTGLAHTDTTLAIATTDVLGRRALVHAAPLGALDRIVTPADGPFGSLLGAEVVQAAGVQVQWV